MKPESQRIAIAEACGWKPNPEKHSAKALDWLHAPSGNTSYSPPDYLNSLDAMHEAEKVLSNEQSPRYEGNLHEVCGRSWSAAIYATAAQRAEAFLRTLNLWTE